MANKDSDYNNQLKKFGDRYFLERNEDNIWAIRCKYGQIQPNDHRGEYLLAVRLGSCRLPRTELSYELTQDASDAKVLRFRAEDIEWFAKWMGARKRRTLTPEQRAKRIETLIPHRFAKHPQPRVA
jgi:hypothetical protein